MENTRTVQMMIKGHKPTEDQTKEIDGVSVSPVAPDEDASELAKDKYAEMTNPASKEKALYKKIADRIAVLDKNGKTYSEEEIMEEFGLSEENILNAPDDIGSEE